ncbi:MAG: RNA polymerase factor sigma-54 [Alphaproteobacteria bacterium]|tara:strand:- start:1471 stop:2928 length:1458 start_codon:yes stop_codon:yes gene_type:complete
MQISQNLKLKQSQSLVMTPQLQQAIKLLQLTNLELTDLVEKELEENPFLEDQSSEEEKTVSDEEEITKNIDDSFNNGDSISDEPYNHDYENRWDNDTNVGNSKNHSEEYNDPGTIIERTQSDKISLKTILLNQAQLEFSDSEEKEMAEILIDYVDPSGLITEDILEISSFSGFPLERIENVLCRMQTFEPSGVFARNLKECLIIQLKNIDSYNKTNQTIIENLELLGNGNLKGLQKITGLTEENLRTEIKLIRSLNPKPGTIYDEGGHNIAHPDVIVTKNRDEWNVELNNSTLPKVCVNDSYVKEIEKLECKDSDKKYINESLNSARWLIKAIEQRNITTLKISSEIINQQKDFFEKGKKFLKPMILKDVAKKINMHESTVSRVTSEKLMMTPIGIFEMKIFFSASINSINSGESHSAESVRESLRKIISDEPCESPLSDEMLVSRLKGEGINLARRTVAKYRELLNIPASSVRRKIMKIQNINI